MSDFWFGILFAALGAFFAVHCSRATLKELRSGRALAGELGDYHRAKSPIGFWMVIAGNATAALMGVGFLIVGLVSLLSVVGIIR